MDLASLYKQQLDVQKQLFQRRLEEIVSALRYAASQTGQPEEQVDAIREALFSEREQAMQRVLEQLAQASAEKDVVQRENEALKAMLKQREEQHQRLKQIYTREHGELKLLRGVQDPGEVEMKRRLQFLEQKLQEKQSKEAVVPKETHDAALKQLAALKDQELQQLRLEFQYKSQQSLLEQEKLNGKLRLGYERKIQQLQQELGETRSRSSLLLQQQQQQQSQQQTPQEPSLQQTLTEKMAELERAAAELLREKQRASDAIMKAKSATATSQFLAKQMKEILREFAVLKARLNEIKAAAQRPMILSEAQIANAADQIQKKTISQQLLKQIASYFYRYAAAKQAETKALVTDALSEIE